MYTLTWLFAPLLYVCSPFAEDTSGRTPVAYAIDGSVRQLLMRSVDLRVAWSVCTAVRLAPAAHWLPRSSAVCVFVFSARDGVFPSATLAHCPHAASSSALWTTGAPWPVKKAYSRCRHAPPRTTWHGTENLSEKRRQGCWQRTSPVALRRRLRCR